MKNNPVFLKALNFTLKWEGGYSNHPDDRGGATNKGITQKTYNTYLKNKGLDKKDVRAIFDSEVMEIYYKMYWLPSNCNNMPEPLAIAVFDTAVNMGVTRAKTLFDKCSMCAKKYLLLRIEKYAQFAKPPSQRKFLLGWLNRTVSLFKHLYPTSCP